MLEDLRSRGGHCSSENLAYHYTLAGIDDKAFEYLLEAGAAALRSYAIENAVRHLTLAQDLIPAAAGPEQRYRLNDLLASAYSATGVPEKAIQFYQRNAGATSDNILRAKILGKVAELHSRVGNSDPDRIRDSRKISRRALFWCRRFPNYLSHAWRACGRAVFYDGRPQMAVSCFQQAIKAAEAIGAQYDLARALLDLSRICPMQEAHYRGRGEALLKEIGAVVPEAER